MIEVSSLRELTTDEIVASIAHSEIPTVLVEGKEDMSLYDNLEADTLTRVLPCGGRNTLLDVYRRRAEFAHRASAFIADKDIWYFTGVPSEFSAGIIFTKGYSIENDVISDSGIMNFYNDDDKKKYDQIASELCKWWAFEINEHLNKRPFYADVKVQKIIINVDTNPQFDETRLTESRSYRQPPQSLVERIQNEFSFAMRGHMLEDIHRILLSRKGGKYKSISGGVTCICAKQEPSVHFKRIIEEVKTAVRN